MKVSNTSAKKKAQVARKWVASPTGKNAIRDAIRLALSTAIGMKKASGANKKKLKEPITL